MGVARNPEKTTTFEQKMVARISSADGTFTAFTPDPEKVFTVEWSVSCSMS